MPTNGEIVLDTSVAVAHLRGVSGITGRLAAHEFLHLPLIALGELHYGIQRSQNQEKNLITLQAWLRIVLILPIDKNVCMEYGQIKSELAKAGTPIPENDIWIAACAKCHKLPLAARDDHFLHVKGLNLLDWTDK